MAICPFAVQRLLPENRTQPASDQRLFIAHSIVGSATGAYGYFLRSTNLESHFIITKAGEIWQLIDTARTADANYHANGFAISVETEDNGDPNNDPWTEAQVYSLIRLGVWARQAHPKIRPQRADKWDGTGYGYHTLFGSPSHWTPVAKSCPGYIRIKQFNDLVLPGILSQAGTIKNPGVPNVATSTSPDQIIWYSKTNPITRKTASHAYVVNGRIAKWLNPAGLNLCRWAGMNEVPNVLGKDWQNTVAILDGPCKNV